MGQAAAVCAPSTPQPLHPLPFPTLPWATTSSSPLPRYFCPFPLAALWEHLCHLSKARLEPCSIPQAGARTEVASRGGRVSGEGRDRVGRGFRERQGEVGADRVGGRGCKGQKQVEGDRQQGANCLPPHSLPQHLFPYCLPYHLTPLPASLPLLSPLQ